MRRLFLLLSCVCLARLPAATWHSPATGRDLTLELLEPAPPPSGAKARQPVVFYLLNLAAPRAGTESDDAILADLRAAGFLVAVLDYAHDPKARVPFINRDFAELRTQLFQHLLLADRQPDQSHIYLVPSGHRLKTDVVFYHDGTRPLAMDIIYPAKPAQPAGAVLEFSCDNADRMGNYSLQFCTDTILPGAATEGFAVAMADHPVAAPYAGLDAMPDCAWKIKAAVRTLRAEGASLGLNGRIVPAGFSRGSGMALMLVTTMGHPEFEDRGEHPGANSEVQGAIVMSGRFTYLDLLADDHMIPRYNKAWGTRADHAATWRDHGALDYLNRPAAFPLFLTINSSESPDALHQMEVLRRRLADLGSPFTYLPEEEPRGHRMPLAPAVLGPIFHYLENQLRVAPAPGPASPSHP